VWFISNTLFMASHLCMVSIHVFELT